MSNEWFKKSNYKANNVKRMFCNEYRMCGAGIGHEFNISHTVVIKPLGLQTVPSINNFPLIVNGILVIIFRSGARIRVRHWTSSGDHRRSLAGGRRV